MDRFSCMFWCVCRLQSLYVRICLSTYHFEFLLFSNFFLKITKFFLVLIFLLIVEFFMKHDLKDRRSNKNDTIPKNEVDTLKNLKDYETVLKTLYV